MADKFDGKQKHVLDVFTSTNRDSDLISLVESSSQKIYQLTRHSFLIGHDQKDAFAFVCSKLGIPDITPEFIDTLFDSFKDLTQRNQIKWPFLHLLKSIHRKYAMFKRAIFHAERYNSYNLMADNSRYGFESVVLYNAKKIKVLIHDLFNADQRFVYLIDYLKK